MNPAVSKWSDAQVRAFVDGKLDLETATRLAAQVRLDLALAERIARERALRARLSGATGTAPGPLWWSAAAAGIVIALLIGRHMPRSIDGPLVPGDSGLRAGGALAEALSQRLSAEGSKERGVLVSLSFKAGDGRYCRTFSLDSGLDGLACRSGNAWQIEATGRSPAQDAPAQGAYRQASSSLSPAVLMAISRRQAGNALTREEERFVRDNGWR